VFWGWPSALLRACFSLNSVRGEGKRGEIGSVPSPPWLGAVYDAKLFSQFFFSGKRGEKGERKGGGKVRTTLALLKSDCPRDQGKREVKKEVVVGLNKP